MPALVYTDVEGARHWFEVEEKASVGRHADNDVVLGDNHVSRRHFLIERRAPAEADGGGEKWALVDLGSSYGTYVNDEKVQGARILQYGDRIRIGNVQIAFVEADAEPTSSMGDEEEPAVKPVGAITESGRGVASEELMEVRRLSREIMTWLESLPPSANAPLPVTRQLLDRLGRTANHVADLERNRILAQTLAEVGRLIHLLSDLDTILEITLDLAVRALHADRGYVLLRGDDGSLGARAAKNMSGDKLHGISKSTAEEVAETGKPVVTTDAQVDPRYNRAESIAIHDIRGVMCVPLRNKDLTTIGAIYVDGPAGLRQFDERGVGFLSDFASHAANAIESARLAARAKVEEEQRARMARYVPAAVLDVVTSDEGLAMKSFRLVTVLFTDIRGFTSLLEKLSPTEAVEMLDDYFTELAAELTFTGGTLDKFTGDGLMAFWNAPAEQPDHALRAVTAALGMQRRLPPLFARWKAEHRSFLRSVEDLPTGIGIHTGEAVVGSIGSPNRKEYTAIGDTVNLAARVQAIAAGGEVLVTETTRNLVGKALAAEPLPPTELKGKTAKVSLWRVRRLLG